MKVEILGKMEDYRAAALRHWQDAGLLENNNRLENADHHYGFAAECAIKKALVSLPSFVNSGSLDKRFKTHINELWGRIALSSLQKAYPSLCALLKASDPYNNWHVDQRYFSDGRITQANVDSHKGSARRILGIVGIMGSRSR